MHHGTHTSTRLAQRQPRATAPVPRSCSSTLEHPATPPIPHPTPLALLLLLPPPQVATPSDPATARRGESLYAFIPRSILGNVVDGYQAEAQRLRARRIPGLSPRNCMLWWVSCPIALAAAAAAAFGTRGLCFMVGHALVSVIMLETVNYVEHYGLLRRKRADGRSVGARWRLWGPKQATDVPRSA